MTKRELIALIYSISQELAIALDNEDWDRVYRVFHELQKVKRSVHQ